MVVRKPAKANEVGSDFFSKSLANFPGLPIPANAKTFFPFKSSHGFRRGREART